MPHVAGVVMVQSVAMAVQFILPVLVQKQFGADAWRTLLVTSPPTVLYVLSIFWNDLFSRASFRRYALLYWLAACMPLMIMGFAHGYWWLLVPHLIACAGGAGWPPMSGAMLKSFYPAELRGRAYSIMWGTMLVCSAIMGFVVGDVLTRDPEAFRVLLPVASGVQLVGIALLILASRAAGGLREVRAAAPSEPWSLRRSLDPVAGMTRVLREDPIFARYEAAYMTYGVGWMIASALLPLLAEQKLRLSYRDFAMFTHVAYLGGLVATLLPAARLLERLGAMRATAVSFLLLAGYPLALAFVRDGASLLMVSVFYGIAHAGASVGWMMGPVTLAPSPDRVPTYVAIHATLVGVRGAVFQFLGVVMFYLLRRGLGASLDVAFGVPLLMGAVAYAWSAWQMWTLHGLREQRLAVSASA